MSLALTDVLEAEICRMLPETLPSLTVRLEIFSKQLI